MTKATSVTESRRHVLHKGGIVLEGRSLLHDISLPAAAIFEAPLANNIAWMQRFAEAHGARLAPHGKTTMTPTLFQRQLKMGAWGITLATATQCAAAFAHGVTRVLMANQLVGHANMALISERIAEGLEFYCVVDGRENVRELGRFFAEKGVRLSVLIELGIEGGRCGCRNRQQVQELIGEIRRQPSLELAGVEGYEGIISGTNPEAAVRTYGDRLVETVLDLNNSGETKHPAPIVTASGSKWFDLIAEAFDRAELREAYTPVLRPGCYVVHDHKLYESAMRDIKARHPQLEGGLQPALEVFAHVQSLPEPGLAIIALGKRDIGCDPDLPMPLRLYPIASQPQAASQAQDVRGWQVMQIMDQHVFLRVPNGAQLTVGDVIAFGTSHPCLTFDKWRHVSLVDDRLNVIESMGTCF